MLSAHNILILNASDATIELNKIYQSWLYLSASTVWHGIFDASARARASACSRIRLVLFFVCLYYMPCILYGVHTKCGAAIVHQACSLVEQYVGLFLLLLVFFCFFFFFHHLLLTTSPCAIFFSCHSMAWTTQTHTHAQTHSHQVCESIGFICSGHLSAGYFSTIIIIRYFHDTLHLACQAKSIIA